MDDGSKDPWKVPNIKTKNKSNLANDDYSGFVENSNSIRFFPSVEERNFSKVKILLGQRRLGAPRNLRTDFAVC